MSILTKAARLFSRRRETKPPENTVEHTAVDRAVLGDWRKRAGALEEAFNEPPEVTYDRPLDDGTPASHTGPLSMNVWQRLCEDVWYEHFGSAEPRILPRDEIAPEFRVNRELADKQARDDKFRERRPRTRLKALESTLGALAAIDSIRESYGNELAEHAGRQEAMAHEQRALDWLDETMEQQRERRAETDDEEAIAAIDADLRKRADEKRRATAALVALEEQQQARAGELVAAAQAASQKAVQRAESAIEAASMLPGSHAGQNLAVPVDTMLELAHRTMASPLLWRVLDMMGRLDLSMGTTRLQMRKGGFEEIVDIETGRELRNVLTHEKMLLMHPMGRLDFFRRFTEESLMQYETWSEQELKRGSLIFAMDGSLSMRGAKNEWCRAFGLAAAGIANREGRPVVLMEYGAKGELIAYRFPKGHPIDPRTAIEFAEHFFAGGTHTLGAMELAIEIMRTDAPFHSADLIIVSDGEDRIHEGEGGDTAIRDELRSMGVKIHGVAVGIEPTNYLLHVCDHTTAIHEYNGRNAATDRLAIDLS